MNNTAEIIKEENKEVALFGVTESKIAELKKTYSGLVIGDTKTYESCKAARTHVVSVRTTIEKGRHRGASKGSKHHLARLSEWQVIEIRKKLASGAKQYSLAAEYKVSQTAISNINLGKRWSHVR